MRILLSAMFLLSFMFVLAVMPPWRLWWTWGKPIPAVGEVWCRPPDGNPWAPIGRFYVLEVHDGWIRYALGTPNGWDTSTALWIFRANYTPCGPRL